jgi:hypothetical protein
MTDQSRLTWALVLSVLLHGLVLSLMPLAGRARIEIPTPRFVDVDLVQLPKAPAAAPAAAPPGAAAVPAPPVPVPERQIVSPPDEGEEKPPENPRLLSDRDNTVKDEMVRRGEPAAGSREAKSAPARKAPPQEQSVQAAPKPPPERAGADVNARASSPKAAALPKLDQLLAQPGDLVREGLAEPGELGAAAPEQHASSQRTDLLGHGDPWGSAGLRGGTRDFLPAVREGDVTLLNTKAEQFAPFVRRVAMRVFENFVIGLRRSYDDGRATEEFATVEAVMDKRGNLFPLHTRYSSLSAALATDRNLQAAVRDGFFDRNPPPGAESNDGNIHFVFNTRVVLVVDPNGRRVPAWALLGAGLM